MKMKMHNVPSTFEHDLAMLMLTIANQSEVPNKQYQSAICSSTADNCSRFFIILFAAAEIKNIILWKAFFEK